MDNCQFEIKGRNYRFWAFGGPIDNPSDANELFQTIGHAISSWARMEHIIDALLVHLNKAAYAQELYEPDHPRNFKKKVELLQHWFKEHPELKLHADAVKSVLPKIKITAHTRHLLAHGSIDSYDATTREITFKSIRPRGNDSFSVQTETLHIKGVLAVAELANAGNRFLAALAMDVFGPDADERFQRPQQQRRRYGLVRRLHALICPIRNR